MHAILWMVKYGKCLITVGLVVFALGMLSPLPSRAAEVAPFVISDSLRSSLLQLLSLLRNLQNLQVLNYQKPVIKAIQSPNIPSSTPASQQALPFIEGFSLPSPPPRSPTLKIISVSPTSGGPGTLVTITGQGLSPSMTLRGGFQSQSISSSDGKTVSFVVAPDMNFSSDLPKVTEKLFLYLEDSSGISNVGHFSLLL